MIQRVCFGAKHQQSISEMIWGLSSARVFSDNCREWKRKDRLKWGNLNDKNPQC